jgi:histidinol-phosphate aminotransferase
MTKHINRRDWLRMAGLATAGAGVLPATATFAAPTVTAPFARITREIRSPETYGWPEKPKVKLNANENVFGPSDKTRLAIMESVALGNRYGHEDALKIAGMIAQKEGVTPQHLMLGPGSTDLLEKVAIVSFLEGGNIVSADPAYMSLVNTARAFKAEWKNVPLDKNWAHDLDAMEKAIDRKTKLVYICNPNNPTGSLTDAKKLWDFCERVSEKVPIFVDEAYLEYLDNSAASSMVGLVAKGKNIIVARTFSKIQAMAGFRFGYMVALPETIKKINDMVRGNMGLSLPTLRGAIAAMNDTEFQANARKWTAESREFTTKMLTNLGIQYVPSYTSFILFPIALPGEEFLKRMTAEGVAVRAFLIGGQHYCRVSIGTIPEMEQFGAALKKALA